MEEMEKTNGNLYIRDVRISKEIPRRWDGWILVKT